MCPNSKFQALDSAPLVKYVIRPEYNLQVPIPEEGKIPALTGAGYSEEGARALIELADGINSNRVTFSGTDIEVVKGEITLEEFIAAALQ